MAVLIIASGIAGVYLLIHGIVKGEASKIILGGLGIVCSCLLTFVS